MGADRGWRATLRTAGARWRGEACWQRALAPARLHKPAEVEVAEGVRCKAELAALPAQSRGGEEVVLHHCCLMGWHCCRSRMVVKKYSPQ